MRNAQAERVWRPSDLPKWLTAQYYDERIRPGLTRLTNRTIRSALNVSVVYAIRIKHGRVRPHARHWLALARLTNTDVT